MNKILTILFLSFVSISFCQNCKIIKNEVDEFTGYKIVEVRGKWLAKGSGILGLGGATVVSIKKINDSVYLVFTISTGDVITTQKGDVLMLKTKSEDIIELPFEETVISENTMSDIWMNKQMILLTKEMIETLKNVKIQKIRFYTTKGYTDNDVKSKHESNISDLLSCLDKIN